MTLILTEPTSNSHILSPLLWNFHNIRPSPNPFVILRNVLISHDVGIRVLAPLTTATRGEQPLSAKPNAYVMYSLSHTIFEDCFFLMQHEVPYLNIRDTIYVKIASDNHVQYLRWYSPTV
jgi:hypothetical protein